MVLFGFEQPKDQDNNLNQTQQFYDFSVLYQNSNFLIELGISNLPIIDYNIRSKLCFEEKYIYMRLNYYYDFKTKI